jgi:hypothetical protein
VLDGAFGADAFVLRLFLRRLPVGRRSIHLPMASPWEETSAS